MNKFKVGDTIKKVRGVYSPYIGIVKETCNENQLKGSVIDGMGNGYEVGDYFNSSNEFFELVENNVKFKVGDKVRFLGESRSFFTKDKIYTVNEFPSKYGSVRVDNDMGVEDGHSPSNFELVSELEDLVKKANEGYGAVFQLRKFNDELEWRGHSDTLWGPYPTYQAGNKASELRVKQKPKFVPFSVGSNWLVKLEGDTCLVGCKKFEATYLKYNLNRLNNNGHPIQGTKNEFRGLRTEVRFTESDLKEHSISWEESEKIVAALEAAGVK